MSSFKISVRLLRGAGRHGLLGTVLTVVAVALSTMLLLSALAANGAFEARADRTAWLTPMPASADRAVAVQATHVEYVRDRAVTVVELGALGPGAPVPPGLSAFPQPGQMFASAELAALLRELPADQLADRFPAATGELGEAALGSPHQLIAVVGVAAADPAMAVPEDLGVQPPDEPNGVPTPIAGFGGQHSIDAIVYDILLKLATAMVVAPLLIFGAAAARLTVARRDSRLAALRLIGATPGQVVGMTVAEAVLTAVAGAVAGALVYVAGFAGLAQIPMQGDSWFASDLWVGLPWMALVLAVVPLLTGVSAAIGLRRVVVSPLGVAQRQTPPAMRWIRIVALVAALVAASMMTSTASMTVVMIVIGSVFLAINLVGPWVVSVIGRITAALARRPARLLAARRLVDDPRAAWRMVAGIALTGFVAGFVGLLSPSMNFGEHERVNVTVTVPEGATVTLDQVRAAVDATGVDASVRAEEPGEDGGSAGTSYILVSVPDDAADVDRVKTALIPVVPGHAPFADTDHDVEGMLMLGDIQVGIRIVLIVSFLVAIASAGIAGASSVLDRRRTYGLLRLAGTPLKVLDKARAIETRIPLMVMGGGSILAGMLCGIPFIAIGVFSPSGLIALGTCVALGFLGVVAASALSRPLLRSVTNSPSPQPD